MSVNGIGAVPAGIGRPEHRPAKRPDGDGAAAERASDVRKRDRPADAGTAQQAAAEAAGVPAATPEGVDPELWSLLTAEERAFFSEARSLGPVTYGPGRSSGQPQIQRGGRIDLTV